MPLFFISINQFTVKPHLFVSTQPHSFNTKPPLFTLGQSYQLNCTASGYPIPEVSWYWSPCDPGDLICNTAKKNDSQWTAVSDRFIDRLKPNEVILVTYNVRESGNYRCMAQSSKFTQREFWTDMEYKLTGKTTYYFSFDATRDGYFHFLLGSYVT